jgi:AraC-like DNA-binding protein
LNLLAAWIVGWPPYGVGMLSSTDVANRAEFAVRTVRCRDDHCGWSAVEARSVHSVVLVRRGRFRRRVGRVDADLDPTTAYVSRPGEEERFAHPYGGDVCTWISVSPALWQSLGGVPPAAGSTIHVDAQLDLAHRRLLAAADDVDFAVAAELVRLLAGVLGSARARSGSDSADRQLAEQARVAVAAGHPAAYGLPPLAAVLGTSPYRLSRAFSRHVGMSLTRYRNRVRIGAALDRIEAGEESLARLAADLGFADQAHLCRTARQQLGETPTALRRLLSPANRSSTARRRIARSVAPMPDAHPYR